MANEVFLVGVANARGYDFQDNLLFEAKTELNTSIEATMQNTDVRGGRGNQLLYTYYHSKELNLNLEDAKFSLDFLALNNGTKIATGADVFTEESVTITNGKGSVTKGAPLAIQTADAYGWVTIPDSDLPERVTFSGSQFTLSDISFNGVLCVRYYTANANARQVVIYADSLPSVFKLVLDCELGGTKDGSSASIGKLTVEVPKVCATGAFTLNMTADAVSTTALALRALAYTDETAQGCESGRSLYARITEEINGANWTDDVIALAIEGGDFDLASGDSKMLKVFALKSGGSASFLAPTSELTFSSDDIAIATVDMSGNVTGVAAGDVNIKVSITDKPSIDANVIVTVA